MAAKAKGDIAHRWLAFQERAELLAAMNEAILQEQNRKPAPAPP
ncbi:hypothetical protein [Delftia acidovorans]|nr:hypothetical protein [Delftia acidovorans]